MSASTHPPAPLRVALVGVPNSGKTALFNRLTGSRQKVANYAGVTVERKEGSFVGRTHGRRFDVTDLPGAYSLTPTTLDEAITRDVLLGRVAGEAVPDLVICVVDAVHLPIGLRLVLEVKRLGLPMVLALNRMDVARRRSVHIDAAKPGDSSGAGSAHRTASAAACERRHTNAGTAIAASAGVPDRRNEFAGELLVVGIVRGQPRRQQCHQDDDGEYRAADQQAPVAEDAPPQQSAGRVPGNARRRGRPLRASPVRSARPSPPGASR